MPSIVQINISLTVAPAPITLQATGAMISQGATTLGDGNTALITQPSDLTAILAAPLALTSVAWSGGIVLATTAATIPGLNNGDTFITTIAGVSPAGYNGTFSATVTGANTFTYALATNPGAQVSVGTFTGANQGELYAMVNTFFSQGISQAVYVLELGPGDETTGPALLLTWAQTNSGVFYSYLVPRNWDSSTGLFALVEDYEALNSKTYFFVTTTTTNYVNYNAREKCIVALVEAPGIPLTEFSLAAPFQHSLAYAPSSANRMTPFAYSYLYGVTPYPTVGNGALLTELKAANINYVGTGAEGGISTAILLWGTTLDGNDFTFWYSADWYQLNCDQALSNAIINGSNNPLNPLYYNQNGVDVLQDVLIGVTQNAITYGLANGTVGRATLDPVAFTQALDNGDYVDEDVINAVPFIDYVTANPSAYKEGSYGGFYAVYIPQRGFSTIIFNIDVSEFITQ